MATLQLPYNGHWKQVYVGPFHVPPVILFFSYSSEYRTPGITTRLTEFQRSVKLENLRPCTHVVAAIRKDFSETWDTGKGKGDGVFGRLASKSPEYLMLLLAVLMQHITAIGIAPFTL